MRAADVLVLGPFMVWAGFKARELPGWARAGLVLTGMGTVIYNGVNFAAVYECRARSDGTGAR